MVLVAAHDIEKRYGARVVLDKVSLTIETGDRLGLIGINGSGKSTLLSILLRREPPDAGQILHKRGLTAAIVDQTPRLDPTETVWDAVRRGQEANLRAARRLDEIADALAHGGPVDALLEEQTALADRLERTGGWNSEHLAEAAMAALGVAPKDRTIGSLSVGEARRVALCAAFLEAPELLVLDEPTNHLDLAAIEWLEVELARWPGALVLVTHDRYFLERVANRHAEIDRGDLHVYEGSYSEYLTAKAERQLLEAEASHKRARAIESELDWVRRRAPARTTKQKARLERFDALVAARPKATDRQVAFRLPEPPRIGKVILELKGVQKSLGGRTLVAGLDLVLKRGDRIGIVGPNGAGKTTLLRMISGQLTPDAGHIELGQNTEIAYVDQGRAELDPNKTIRDEVAGESDFVYVGDEAVNVHTYLEGLLFDRGAHRMTIGVLSGGERGRVALAKSLRQRANLLILDEPTNDLDLPTLRVLEEALLAYNGCALIVSHDRYFLDRVTTAILAFEGDGRVVLHEGSYELYRERSRAARALEAPPPPPPAPKPEAPRPSAEPRAKKRSFKEEREFLAMEETILAAEAAVAALEAEVNQPDAARALGPKIGAKLSALEAARREVERLYARWAELGELAGS